MRTPVGLRCQACADPGPAAAVLPTVDRRRRFPVLAVVAALIVAVGGWALLHRPAGHGASDTAIGIDAPVRADSVVVGTGRSAEGAEWTLRGRRKAYDSLCTSFVLGNATVTPVRESCEPPPNRQRFGGMHAVANSSTYASWGTVPAETDRVRMVATDGTVTEVRPVGTDAGLGAGFFVVFPPRNVIVTLMALATDGRVLARRNLTSPPPVSSRPTVAVR